MALKQESLYFTGNLRNLKSDLISMSWCVREDFWPGDEILHVEFQGDTKK